MALLLKIVRISTLSRLQPLLAPSPLLRLQPSLQPNRHLSQLIKFNGNPAFLDTLFLMRSLEAAGFPSKQAEIITCAISEVFNISKQSFVSKGEMYKVEMVHEANLSKFLSKFNSEIKSYQEHQFTMLRSDMNIMKTELKAQLEAATAGWKAQLEAAKLDIIKYYIGSVVAIAGVGLAVVRLGL